MKKNHKNILTVLGFAKKVGKRKFVRCSCECGGECVIRSDHVEKKGHCGCLTKQNLGVGMRTHGMYQRREYGIWVQMRERCTNPKSIAYQFYGERGVSVCDEWDNSFQAFIDHIGLSPSKSHTLDRIDCAGNYEPGNVRWATRKQQARNTSRNVMVTAHGKTMTVADWAEEKGVAYHVLAYRIRKGWDHQRAIDEPLDMSKSFPVRRGTLREDGVFVKE